MCTTGCTRRLWVRRLRSGFSIEFICRIASIFRQIRWKVDNNRCFNVGTLFIRRIQWRTSYLSLHLMPFNQFIGHITRSWWHETMSIFVKTLMIYPMFNRRSLTGHNQMYIRNSFTITVACYRANFVRLTQRTWMDNWIIEKPSLNPTLYYAPGTRIYTESRL